MIPYLPSTETHCPERDTSCIATDGHSNVIETVSVESDGDCGGKKCEVYTLICNTYEICL